MTLRRLVCALALVALALGIHSSFPPEAARADTVDSTPCIPVDIQYAGGSTLLLITAPNATAQVVVCDFNLFGLGVVTASLQNGTGVLCATNPVIWSGLYTATATVPFNVSKEGPTAMPTGANVCLVTTGAVLVQGEIDYRVVQH
jgi:hypothetical protein